MSLVAVDATFVLDADEEEKEEIEFLSRLSCFDEIDEGDVEDPDVTVTIDIGEAGVMWILLSGGCFNWDGI